MLPSAGVKYNFTGAQFLDICVSIADKNALYNSFTIANKCLSEQISGLKAKLYKLL